MKSHSRSAIFSAALLASFLPSMSNAQDATSAPPSATANGIAPDVLAVLWTFKDGSQQICAVDGHKGVIQGTNGVYVKFQKRPEGDFEYTTAAPVRDQTGSPAMAIVKVLIDSSDKVTGHGADGQEGTLSDTDAAPFLKGFHGMQASCTQYIAETRAIGVNFPQKSLHVNEKVAINVPGTKVVSVIGLGLGSR